MLAVAISQPSAELAAYAVSTPSGQEPSGVSIPNAPSSAGTWRLPTRPSTRLSSISGLIPGATRRNTFRMACSPKTTLVLLCSAATTRGAAPTGRLAPGSRPNRISPTTAESSISDSSSRAESGW